MIQAEWIFHQIIMSQYFKTIQENKKSLTTDFIFSVSTFLLKYIISFLDIVYKKKEIRK